MPLGRGLGPARRSCPWAISKVPGTSFRDPGLAREATGGRPHFHPGHQDRAGLAPDTDEKILRGTRATLPGRGGEGAGPGAGSCRSHPEPKRSGLRPEKNGRSGDGSGRPGQLPRGRDADARAGKPSHRLHGGEPRHRAHQAGRLRRGEPDPFAGTRCPGGEARP